MNQSAIIRFHTRTCDRTHVKLFCRIVTCMGDIGLLFRQASSGVRWTRRREWTGHYRMRLTEQRRELIPQVRWCICERAVGD